eukprot:scaffold8685_cov82-Skeletonema_marinoi.AAC.3
MTCGIHQVLRLCKSAAEIAASTAAKEAKAKAAKQESLSTVSTSAGRGLRYLGTLNRQGRNISQLATILDLTGS